MSLQIMYSHKIHLTQNVSAGTNISDKRYIPPQINHQKNRALNVFIKKNMPKMYLILKKV